jgi:hypothetical protein
MHPLALPKQEILYPLKLDKDGFAKTGVGSLIVNGTVALHPIASVTTTL